MCLVVVHVSWTNRLSGHHSKPCHLNKQHDVFKRAAYTVGKKLVIDNGEIHSIQKRSNS